MNAYRPIIECTHYRVMKEAGGIKAKTKRRKAERGDRRDSGRKACRENSRSGWSLEGEGRRPRSREEVYEVDISEPYKIRKNYDTKPSVVLIFYVARELNIYL